VIRETIGDLRDVIRNADAESQSLEALLADLRIETADRVELAGLTLQWHGNDPPTDAQLPRDALRALRALVREAVSNALRHAKAGHPVERRRAGRLDRAQHLQPRPVGQAEIDQRQIKPCLARLHSMGAVQIGRRYDPRIGHGLDHHAGQPGAHVGVIFEDEDAQGHSAAIKALAPRRCHPLFG
jgi:hypothetical protein